MLGFCMPCTIFVITLVLVPLLKHSQLRMNCFCDLICKLEVGVSSQVKIFNIVRKDHMEFQAFTHFEFCVEWSGVAADNS